MNFFFCSILAIACLSLVSCHTFVIQPTSRDQDVHTNGAGGQFECGGNNNNNQGQYTRGQVIDFSWGRNNHYGGFVQVSVILKTAAPNINDAAVRESLDQPTNIIHVSCYNQLSCRACNGCGDFLGRGGDGTAFQGNPCRTKMTIPTYLADGDYVMKTVFFGNGDSFGVRNLPHSSYSSCSNFRLAGGATLTTKVANSAAHIEWGAPGMGLYDHALALINRPQGACLFQGTTSHNGCRPTNVAEQIACTGPTADIARCGTAQTDSVQTCLGSNTAGQTRGGSLFNYMIGLPSYHPQFNSKYTMVLENRNTKEVQLPGGGGGTGNTGGNANPGTGGGATPPANDGSCAANGDCKATPNCCRTGTACYEKDQYYAGCYAPGTCQPGVHLGDPAEYRSPWTCNALTVGGNTNAQTGAFGIYWKVNMARLLDVASARNANGNPVWSWENYGPGVAQQWQLTAAQQIQWVGTNKCLDSSGQNVDGAKVIIWECDAANANQKWTKVGDTIQWVNTNKCLDITNGNVQLGTLLQIYTCNAANTNQQFVFQSILRSGPLYVAPQALNDATTVQSTQTIVTSLVWKLNDYPTFEKDGLNATSVFLPVNVGSIKFVGASDTNPIYQTCSDYYNSRDRSVAIGLDANNQNRYPCEQPWTAITTSPYTFTSTTMGDYYFVGMNSDSTNTRQQIVVSFVDVISSTDIAKKLNENIPATHNSDKASSAMSTSSSYQLSTLFVFIAAAIKLAMTN